MNELKKFEGKGVLGRTRLRWGNNIKQDLKKGCDHVKGNEMAQDSF
jgi:hypothetical protein